MKRSLKLIVAALSALAVPVLGWAEGLVQEWTYSAASPTFTGFKEGEEICKWGGGDITITIALQATSATFEDAFFNLYNSNDPTSRFQMTTNGGSFASNMAKYASNGFNMATGGHFTAARVGSNTNSSDKATYASLYKNGDTAYTTGLNIYTFTITGYNAGTNTYSSVASRFNFPANTNGGETETKSGTLRLFGDTGSYFAPDKVDTGSNVVCVYVKIEGTQYVAPTVTSATISADTDASAIGWDPAIELADNVDATLTATADVEVAMDEATTLRKLTIGEGSKITFTGEQTLTSAITVINADTDVSAIKANLGIVAVAKDVKLIVGPDTSWTSISGDGVIYLDGTELKISSDLAGNIEIGPNGGTISATSGHIAITGVISGSGALTLNGGAGSLAIKNASNTYSGDATIASGAVYVGNYGDQNSGTASVFPAKSITVKNGASFISHATGECTWNFDILLEDGATLGIKDAIGIANGDVTFAGNLAINGNANFTFHWCKGANFTGVISGTGTLTITGNTAEGGTSTLKLSNAANTFTGTYKLASTSNAVKLIVGEGAAKTATISLEAANDSVEFSAAADTVAGIGGTAGTVTTSLDATELTVTGTADVEKLILDKVTIPGVSGGEGGGEDPEEPTGPVCTDGISASYNSIAEAIEAGCTYIMMTAATTEDVTLPEGYTLQTMGATITGKVTIEKGAILYVLNGGTIAGDLTFEDGAFLNIQSGDFKVFGAVNFPAEGTFNLTMNTIPAMGDRIAFITSGAAVEDDDVKIGTLKFIVGKEENTTDYKVVTTEETNSYDVTTVKVPICDLDGTIYTDLAEAIAAASAEDYTGARTIKLSAAATLEAVTVDIGDENTLTIDLNGYSISNWEGTVMTIQSGIVEFVTSDPDAYGNMVTSTGLVITVGTDTSVAPSLIVGEKVSIATMAPVTAVNVVKGTIGGAGTILVGGDAEALTMAAGTTLDVTHGVLTLTQGSYLALLGVPEEGTITIKAASTTEIGDTLLNCDTAGLVIEDFTAGPAVYVSPEDDKLVLAMSVAVITRDEVRTYYPTIQDAVDAATDGEEISLIPATVTTIELDEAVTVDKAVTIDLNGALVRATDTVFNVEKGDLTLTGSTGIITCGGVCIVVDGGKVTIEDGLYNNKDAEEEGTALISLTNAASLTINGGNFVPIDTANPFVGAEGCELVITGGSFTDFNPEKLLTTDYEVVAEAFTGETGNYTIYTVQKADKADAAAWATLEALFEAGELTQTEFASITEIANPEVVDIITSGLDATVKDGVATFTYEEFKVSEIVMDGNTIKVTVTVGDLVFADDVVVALVDLDGNHIETVEDGEATFTKGAGTQLFKAKAMKPDQTNEEGVEPEE